MPSDNIARAAEQRFKRYLSRGDIYGFGEDKKANILSQLQSAQIAFEDAYTKNKFEEAEICSEFMNKLTKYGIEKGLLDARGE